MYIYPKAIRHVRDLLRRRLLLVKQRTAKLLSLQSMIGRHSGLRLSSHQVKRLTQDDLAYYFKADATSFAEQQTHQLMQQLNTQTEAMEAFVLARCVPSVQAQRRLTNSPFLSTS